jgi:hypothetical protein
MTRNFFSLPDPAKGAKRQVLEVQVPARPATMVDVASHPGLEVLVLADLDGRLRGIGCDPSSQLDKNVARLERPARVHGSTFVAFTHIEGRENRLSAKAAA